MLQRPLREFSPHLERLETKQLLSASASAAQAPGAQATLGAGASSTEVAPGSKPNIPLIPISLDRVTNPSGQNALFNPPFGHVLVQVHQPIPGQVYNVLFLSVYNNTGLTFNASDGLGARTSNLPAGRYFPILTGNQVWGPGGRIVFYVVSKKYYPLTPTQSAGFQVNFATPRATAIPGPSGIALRIKYNPATFLKILDHYVTSGPGAIGHQFGLPDTALWQILPNSGKVVRL